MQYKLTSSPESPVVESHFREGELYSVEEVCEFFELNVHDHKARSLGASEFTHSGYVFEIV